MANSIQAVRGMNDILPSQTSYWCYLEETLRQIASAYCYSEIRFPLLEQTALFKRTIGEVTDIIEKEMYTFDDRNGDSLSLRPEGTAGCVRAGIQNGLFHNQQQRLWYLGPMFRYERPQLGRFRQFFQFGIEAFGMAEAIVDVEQILMTSRIWQSLGLKDQIKLQINTLGSSSSREKYREKLIEFFSENIDTLDEDSRRRLTSNPLRILDSKNPDMQLMLTGAPRMLDYLDDNSKAHFDNLRRYLDKSGIDYEVNPRIVRGLDYYNMTVYEWVTDRLGAQGTVCAGGRYDGLVEHLGGKSTPAVGFAMGLERVATLLESVYSPDASPQVYIIMVGQEAFDRGLSVSEKLHTLFPEIRIACDYSAGSFKNQFRRADKSGAKLALIFGQDEIQNHTVSLKYLREDRPQCTLPEDELHQCLLKALVD
ncbi:MAG: histidine--tRNA ligase [Gammaproteobacteria bacterium]|nr:histidine--tRNA ligase [Gammaproteobacteria bacterium]